MEQRALPDVLVRAAVQLEMRVWHGPGFGARGVSGRSYRRLGGVRPMIYLAEVVLTV